MDTLEQALADGEALLRQLERKERERETRRRNFKTVDVPLRTHGDGITSVQSYSVPRTWP
jgi:hypothetical protein